MEAYKLYSFNKISGNELIGVLPERRRNPERMTPESILKWAKIVLGDFSDVDLNNFFFIQITIDEKTGRISESTPSFRIRNEDQKINQHSIVKEQR